MKSTQWVQAKCPNEIKLEGLDIELDWTDSTVNSIIIRDAKGNALRIIKGEYSGMRAMIPPPKPTVDRWRVHGTYRGEPFDHLFHSESGAERFCESLGVEAKTLDIEKIEVPLDQAA